jgi:hypothetical protein
MPGQNEWIYIDLEDTMSISEVKLIWFFDNPDVYELQTSNNKADWQTVFRDETGTGRVIYANPDSAAGRYLRVLFSGSPSQEGYNLWELEVYGEIYKKPEDDSTITSFPVKEKSSSYLNIFPNPTSDDIKVDFKIDTTCNVKIFLYDTNGNKLDKLLDSNENQGIHQIKYDCSNLSSGEYLILMNCEDIIRTNRFLIVK